MQDTDGPPPAEETKPMTLDRQTVANRQNGKLGGVRTDAGKRASRLNARKHGILASCLTQLDHRRLKEFLEQFMDHLEPVGAVEEALVEKIAVTYLRMQRCAMAECEYHHAAWLPLPPGRLMGPLGTVSWLRPRPFERIARLINRYDTSLTNQFLKLLHELERRQRARKGDGVKPPTVVQVDVNR